jgi:capsular exopolysaccharide synthesis family protein
MLPGKESEARLQDYFQIILRRKWTIITFFVVLVTTVTIGSLIAKPIYRATTTLLIEMETPTVLNIKDVVSLGDTSYYSYKDYYETQYKIIKSRSVASEVYTKLNLNKKREFAKQVDPIVALLKTIDVEPIKNSRLVKINVENYDPVLAAEIANTFAKTYAQENLRRKIDAAKEAVSWLSQQINKQQEEVDQSQLALQEYRVKYNIVSLPTVEVETQPAGAENLIETLMKNKANLEMQLSNLSSRYKDKHPKMARLKSELTQVEAEIKKETERLLELNEKAIQYNILRRDVESNQGLYDLMLTRMKETSVAGPLEVNNIRIVDLAEVPKRPAKPRIKLNIALAMVMGLTLGVGLAFFQEYLDNTVKTPEDIERYIQLPFLGFIPSSRAEAKGPIETDLISYYNPKSTIAEAYRSIRTGITFSSAVDKDKPVKSILVTSAGPQEGKTTNLINLGITMSGAGDRVLLVDSDMRRPRIHKTFKLDNTLGLTNFLVGNADLDTVVKKTEIPNLSVVTCGPIPPNPAELIGSEKMKEFIKLSRERFDRILFDSPPIIAVTDAVILATMVDGVIQIIQCERTACDIILNGKQKLMDVNARILGTLLNDVHVEKGGYYYYHYYHYYYYGDKGEKKPIKKRRHLPEELTEKVLSS